MAGTESPSIWYGLRIDKVLIHRQQVTTTRFIRRKKPWHVISLQESGQAGLATAKWLNDRGYQVTLLEKRDVPGGKVSAWRDPDGDWVESGLHVFFGAYHNLLDFLAEVDLADSFDWKPAEMIFALQGANTPQSNSSKAYLPLNGVDGCRQK
jgi:predicted NAD/FAD-binding protein